MIKRLDIYRPHGRTIVETVLLKVRSTLFSIDGDVLIDEKTRSTMQKALEEHKADFHDYDVEAKLDVTGERPYIRIIVGHEEICALG